MNSVSGSLLGVPVVNKDYKKTTITIAFDPSVAQRFQVADAVTSRNQWIRIGSTSSYKSLLPTPELLQGP